jgi:hypothetical protein
VTYSFLFIRIAVRLGLPGSVCLAADGFPFSGFARSVSISFFPLQLVDDVHVEVIDVVPDKVERFLVLINIHRKPDVPAFPEGVGIPLYSLPSIRLTKDKLT